VSDPSGFGLADILGELTDEFVAASRRSLDWFARPIDVANKNPHGFDPVTEADRAVEDLLREVVLGRFPGHAVVGEERGRSGGSSEFEWIIDPIDGTRSFITGRPMWGSLVGVSRAGVPIAGWMHVPVLDQTFVGFNGTTTRISGGKATLVSVSSTVSLANSVLMCTHPSMFEDPSDRAAFDRIDAAARLSRFDGDCFNYGLLAGGFGDLVVEGGLRPYDILPLVPIVEGAGGIITDLDGQPVSEGWAVAAATPELHAEALATLCVTE